MNTPIKLVAGGTLALLLFAGQAAHAFNAETIGERLNLTDSQVAALEEAHELRKNGDREGARAVLEDANINLEDLRAVRQEVREEKRQVRQAIKETVADEDYDEFRDLADGTKIGDIIDSESDFERLVEAHQLREDGDRAGAREIMQELGFEPKEHGKRPGGRR